MNRIELAELRRNFSSKGLSEESVVASPFDQFAHWIDEALKAEIIDANAMTLSTVGGDGRPSARVVLLKHFDESGFAFYTNYGSKKARDLAVNPYAVLHFFWPQLDRQAAVYGSVTRTSRAESEKYFRSRPLESRLSAWASNQSASIESRAVLERVVEEYRAKFGDDIPLPDFWGGFRLVPDKFEFWQGRQNRLHDRIVFLLEGDNWKVVRLAP